jgi:hypothetical protein
LELRGRKSRLISCLVYSSAPKMEAKCSSDTSVDFERTTRGYMPEDITLQNRERLDLRRYKSMMEKF